MNPLIFTIDIIGLIVGLVASLVVSLAESLAVSLPVDLVESLMLGLAGLCLNISSKYFGWFFLFGFAVGFMGGLEKWDCEWGLGGGLTGELLVFFPGLLVFLPIAFILVCAGFFVLIVNGCLNCFRLVFYLGYLLEIFSPIDFYHNPYLYDGVIWLPLPTVRTRLARLAYQQPETASAFVDFLLEYRPLQENLANRQRIGRL